MRRIMVVLSLVAMMAMMLVAGSGAAMADDDLEDWGWLGWLEDVELVDADVDWVGGEPVLEEAEFVGYTPWGEPVEFEYALQDDGTYGWDF